MIGDGVLDRARALGPQLVTLRRDLHAHPELGFYEDRTRHLARTAVEAAGWTVLADSTLTGVVASLGPRPRVLLRACIDALPIDDPKDVPYRSLSDGVCHACGHDAQTAVLVGAARLLAEFAADAPVAVLYQPAEEIDTGARSVVDSGVLDDMDLATIIGFHGHPDLRAGQIAVAPGPIMANISTVRATITGLGGHGAQPHLTADVVSSLAALINDWQVALGRRIDGRRAVVLSIGRVQAGTSANVIPGEAHLEGTLRYLDPDLRHELSALLSCVASAVATRFGTEVSLTIDDVVPALVNDRATAMLVADSARDLLGAHAVLPPVTSLGGDDFAFLLERAPGCYFFLGEGQPGRERYGWHDPSYDLDEDSIPVGSAVLAVAALRAVERSIT